MVEEKKIRHSGLGITSFVLAIINLLIFIAALVIGGIISTQNLSSFDETSPLAVVLGAIIILSFVLSLLGLGLGIAGVCSRNKKKIFAILGVIFNLVFIITVTVLFIFGISQQGSL